MNGKKLAELCLHSINAHHNLKNHLKGATDKDQRATLEAWYHGYHAAHETHGPAQEQANFPTLEAFHKEMIPQLRQEVAA